MSAIEKREEHVPMPSVGGPPSAGEMDQLKEQVRLISATTFVPKEYRGKPHEILACILTGRSLGLDPMHALRSIHIVEGKATLSAELMVALARNRGHSIEGETTSEKATVKGKRGDNGDEFTVTFTHEDAKRAGLTGRANWKTYPEDMMWARAVSRLCRRLFPDVVAGVSYTSDEAEPTEAHRVEEAVANLTLPPEAARTREDPAAVERPSDAQLNAIAALEQEIGGPPHELLFGAYGAESADELSKPYADQYEKALGRLAEEQRADVAVEGEVVEDGDTTFEIPDSARDAAEQEKAGEQDSLEF